MSNREVEKEDTRATEIDRIPQRIQRQRTKGWRMPEGAVYVGRPTVFGNPFRAYKCDCCGYWDVRDDNGVTYLVDHQYVRQAHVRADRRTWTTRHQANREAVRLYNDELTYWVGGRMFEIDEGEL